MQPIRESGLSQDSCQLCRRARADVRVQPCGHAVHSRCCLFWPLPACPVCSAACQHIMLLPFYPYIYNGREHTAPSTTPELRVGAWGPEELKYTYALIDAWSKGILPVSRHAKSRNVLTTLLHCLPARLSAKIRLGRAEKVIQLQPDALDAKEVLQLRLQAKQTFELEEAFLQQETFKTADPNLTAGLLLVMQQEWQRQLVDLCTERGQKFYHQPKKPTIPPPRVPTTAFPLPVAIPPPPAAATAPPLPLVPPPLERVHLSTLFEAPPAPTNVSSPTIRGRQARNLEEGLDCFQQIVDVLHNITDENGRADAQQYAIEAVMEVCCYHQKARSLICSAEGELLHASHDVQCTLTREAVVGILQATSIGPKTHWCDGNLLIGETVTVVAGAPCQVRSIHYLGLVFLVLSNAGRSASGSVSSQPGDRSSLRKRKDCATPTTLSSDNTHRKSLASSTRSSMSYFEDDEFDDDYRRSSEDRCRRLTSPSVCTSEPSMSSSMSSSNGSASLSQHLQRFLDFIPFEAVDLWVPVNAGGETRLYSGAWAISEPSLIDWIKYSREFSFALHTPIPGTVYGSRSPEVYHDLSALPPDFSARAEGAKRYGIKGCLALPIAMADGRMLVGMWYSQQPYTAPREMVQYITDVVQSWKADVKLEYLPSVAPSNELEPTGLYSEDVLTHVF